MKNDYPITLKSVLPVQKFFILRDEFKYAGWSLSNHAGYGNKETDKVFWRLNGENNNLIMYDCASFVKLKLQKYLQQELIFIRAQSNGTTFGQSSQFHMDFTEDNVWTFVLFTEKNWNTQWGGEFVVLNPTSNEYKYVSYIPNNGVLIPSNWLHYGMEPNHFTDKLRTTIAFTYTSLQSLEIMKQKKVVRRFL